MIEPGLTHTSRLTVERRHTAMEVGSGDLPVLATPAMLALMENAAMTAVARELPGGQTTVGAFIEASHLSPTGIGREVTATATLESAEGRKLTFRIVARQGDTVIGEGTHIRYIVDRAKFLSRLQG